jgi:hypothetical protein
MINTRDKHDFARLREPRLEDLSLPPAFLLGSRRLYGPFEPISTRQMALIGRDLVPYQAEPWRVSLVELVGVFTTGATLGFVLGYFLAFVR